MRTGPSDTGNALTPTALSLPGPHQPLAYEPEYSLNTYEEVINDLMGVVNTTQPGKKMYPYWSGSEATRRVKADMARRWVEVYKAQKTR
jgi:hypothetical protein